MNAVQLGLLLVFVSGLAVVFTLAFVVVFTVVFALVFELVLAFELEDETRLGGECVRPAVFIDEVSMHETELKDTVVVLALTVVVVVALMQAVVLGLAALGDPVDR